mmetsp:Transcript_32762/g.60205  ORF Transcript_32762/g.60205 Transcript_32762/m.60205 type:complete len:158 (-) Transcript_32762:1076-1549(-)
MRMSVDLNEFETIRTICTCNNRLFRLSFLCILGERSVHIWDVWWDQYMTAEGQWPRHQMSAEQHRQGALTYSPSANATFNCILIHVLDFVARYIPIAKCTGVISKQMPVLDRGKTISLFQFSKGICTAGAKISIVNVLSFNCSLHHLFDTVEPYITF